jgi:plasmid stabilization system protein ParE
VVPKRVLGDIDLTDEQGFSVPALNREDESELTRHFIVLYWLTNYVDPRTKATNPAAKEEDIPRDALQLLDNVIRSNPEAASAYIESFERGWEAWKDTVRDRAQETLLSLVRLLADQAMIYALLQDVRLGVRRIVKLSYNDIFPSTGSEDGQEVYYAFSACLLHRFMFPYRQRSMSAVFIWRWRHRLGLPFLTGT